MTTYDFEAAFHRAYNLISGADTEIMIHAARDGVHYVIVSVGGIDDMTNTVYIHYDSTRNAILTIVDPTHGDVQYVRRTYLQILSDRRCVRTRNREEILQMMRVMHEAYTRAMERGELRWELIEGLLEGARR